MTESRSLTYSETIAAPVSQVYRAFATSQGVQEWLADIAEADGREGGRFYAYWNQGFYASGMYQGVEEDQSVEFTWHAVGEPGPTTVRVELEGRDGGTEVTLTHSGLGEGEEWDAVRENFDHHWPSGLGNLKSVLETGIDKRVYDRPMLGFWIGGLVDEAMQERLSLPLDYGMHVAGTLEGMCAERSGLKQDDVITEVDGVEVRTFQSIGPVLAKYKGGDTVQTVVYRDGERMELGIELSKRPIPDFPPPPEELAALGRSVYKEVLADLKAVLDGVSDEEAGTKPGEDEWSAKEVMAHLLVGERWNQAAWDLHANGNKFPAYPGSNRIIKAIAKTYSKKRLYKELKRSIAVNMNMIEALPEEYAANKAAYFLSANDFENGVRTHWGQHTDQIKAGLEKLREPVMA